MDARRTMHVLQCDDANPLLTIRSERSVLKKSDNPCHVRPFGSFSTLVSRIESETFARAGSGRVFPEGGAKKNTPFYWKSAAGLRSETRRSQTKKRCMEGGGGLLVVHKLISLFFGGGDEHVATSDRDWLAAREISAVRTPRAYT